jgi:hypothetical protein
MKKILLVTSSCVAIFATALLFAFNSPNNYSNDRLTTLLFKWHGSINQEPINASGSLFIDRNTGNFTAAAAFDKELKTFNPAAAGWSILSVSCQNSPKDKRSEEEVIIDIANDNYVSTRTVKIYNAKNEMVADFKISGDFHRLSHNAFKADATISGYYNGPIDLEYPKGYTLCVKPDGNNRLTGNFTMDLFSKSGEKFRAEHAHEYLFVDGTKKSPKPQSMDLVYDAQNAQYDSQRGFLRFSGNSSIRTPSAIEMVNSK